MINLSAEEIERRINILKTQTFYIGPSYYPEKSPSLIKSVLMILLSKSRHTDGRIFNTCSTVWM